MPFQSRSTIFLIVIIICGLGVLTVLYNSYSVTCAGCNVILISVDTLGAKHVTDGTAPSLLTLAQQYGVSYTEAYSQSSWTLPSHIAMFTGLDFKSTIFQSMPERAYTIAEALQEQNYETHALSTGPFVQAQWGFAQGFDTFDGSIGPETAWEDAPRLFETSLDWIETRDSSRPYFLFIHSFHPHDPYGGVSAYDISQTNRQHDLSPADSFMAAYHSDIREFDAAFRAFFETLESRGELKNTILIITSDHGEEFAEHGSVALHGSTLYREVTHVPLIVFHPYQRPGERSASVSVSAIPNTITDALGIPTLLGPHTSLLRTWHDTIVTAATENNKDGILDAYARRDEMMAQFAHIDADRTFRFPEAPATTEVTGLASAIRGKWHLIRNSDSSYELFNMDTDPDEQENLFLKQSSLPKVDQMNIRLLLEELAS